MPTNIMMGSVAGEWSEFPPVLATENGMRVARGITVPPENYPADFQGRRVIKPGQSWVKDANGLGVPVKATKVFAVNAKILTVSDSGLFKVGDVLTLGDGTTAVGEVATIDSPTQITLKAAATGTPAGKSILTGTAPVAGEVLGISLSLIDLDSFSNDVAIYTACNVYVERMPWYDVKVHSAGELQITPVPYVGFAADYAKPIPTA